MKSSPVANMFTIFKILCLTNIVPPLQKDKYKRVKQLCKIIFLQMAVLQQNCKGSQHVCIFFDQGDLNYPFK